MGSAAWYLFLALVLIDEFRRRRTGVNGMVKLDITKGIVTGLVLGTKSAGYAVAGLLVMSIPKNPNGGGAIEILSMIFIANNIFLTLLAIYYLVNRSQTNREMDRAEAQDRRSGDPGQPVVPAEESPPCPS